MITEQNHGTPFFVPPFCLCFFFKSFFRKLLKIPVKRMYIIHIRSNHCDQEAHTPEGQTGFDQAD